MVVSSGALQQEGPGFESILGPFCVYMFSVSVWVFSRCYGFLPQYKNIHRVVNVRENGCLSVSITGDLSRVYPVSCPITAGTGSRPPN